MYTTDTKFDIGQKVFIYDCGIFIEKIISKVQITISKKRCEVGYQFEKDSMDGIFYNFFKPEREVFSSVDEFIKQIKIGNSNTL